LPPPDSAGVSALHAVDSVTYFAMTFEVRDTTLAGAPLLGFYRRYGRLSASAASLVTRLLGEDAQLRIGAPGTPVWTDLLVGTEPPPTHAEDLNPGEYRAQDGLRWTGAAAPIGGTPWVVWVGYPRSVVIEPAVTFVERMSPIAALFVIAAILLAALLGFGIARPLHALTHAAEEIAAGDYGRRVELRRRDEIGRLGASFNIMSSRVEGAHDALRDVNQLTNFALSAARIGVWEAQVRGGVMTCSDSMALVHGISRDDLPVTSDEFLRLVHPDDRSRMRALLHSESARDQTFDVEYRAQWPDGSVHWIEGKGRVKPDEDGRAVAVLGVSIDVTDRRLLEAQFQQAQKMEAVGQLAGGIAHDFNNLLTAIIGHGDMLMAELPEDSRARADVTGVMNAAESAARLTRQLLTFSRRSLLQPEVLSPNDVIARTESLLRRLIPAHIDVCTELAADAPPVRIDPSHLEQVIINLALNARDAMPGGGTLKIATERVQFTPRPHTAAPAGICTLIRVSDNGMGMDAETRAHIFEPFFTTKPPGQGTGLGLATVFGIVQQTGGAIDLESEPGEGTTFRVWLPAVEEWSGAPDRTPPPRPGTGHERILIVDDDSAVRSVTCRILRRLGYKVVEAVSGEDALLKLAAGDALPDLVITDLVMPGMTGAELYRELTLQYPQLRVLFTSGYAPDNVGMDIRVALFIEKPYTTSALAARVREALERDAA
ncbi:MAG TPA: ATP-binding protein, partial [Longimicrobiales bacterium]|nr:ATP-binding protein [Longimicrobiales bacterium]